MVNMETTTVVDIAVAAAVEAVAMEEDVVDETSNHPLMILTASYHSSLL